MNKIINFIRNHRIIFLASLNIFFGEIFINFIFEKTLQNVSLDFVIQRIFRSILLVFLILPILNFLLDQMIKKQRKKNKIIVQDKYPNFKIYQHKLEIFIVSIYSSILFSIFFTLFNIKNNFINFSIISYIFPVILGLISGILLSYNNCSFDKVKKYLRHELIGKIKEIEKNQAFYQGILETIPIGILTINFKILEILGYNKTFENIFKIKNKINYEELTNKKVIFENIEDIKEKTSENIVNGKYYIRTITKLEEDIYNITYIDISKLKKTQDELSIYIKRTVEKVNVETMELMLRSISHEIKNPLMAMKIQSKYLYRIGKKVNEISDLEGLKLIRKLFKCNNIIPNLNSSISNMEIILNDIRKLAHCNVDKLVKNHNIKELLENILKTVQIYEDLPEITFNFYPLFKDLIVSVNRSKIQQILLNLILNSKEHGNATRVKIFICGRDIFDKNAPHKSCYKEKGCTFKDIGECSPKCQLHLDLEFIKICVYDNGTGISKKDAKNIFKPFYSTRGGGLEGGIGLPVSKKNIESMGGTIEMFPRYGNTKDFSGVTFVIKLPIVKFNGI